MDLKREKTFTGTFYQQWAGGFITQNIRKSVTLQGGDLPSERKNHWPCGPAASRAKEMGLNRQQGAQRLSWEGLCAHDYMSEPGRGQVVESFRKPFWLVYM